eukprot:TRINITY_DN4358_c2_g2_i1.p1 TRINITY_DN4358_c2_g2~~TRINITY_DN4358_c2_g2_i1.p1  ORF type:complete len:225 (-),score=36.07 TRINITY_DN4358_c2_g2_i1:217-861(-)
MVDRGGLQASPRSRRPLGARTGSQRERPCSKGDYVYILEPPGFRGLTPRDVLLTSRRAAQSTGLAAAASAFAAAQQPQQHHQHEQAAREEKVAAQHQQLQHQRGSGPVVAATRERRATRPTSAPLTGRGGKRPAKAPAGTGGGKEVGSDVRLQRVTQYVVLTADHMTKLDNSMSKLGYMKTNYMRDFGRALDGEKISRMSAAPCNHIFQATQPC